MKWDEYDFIVDESSERMPSVVITGWESVIFELADDRSAQELLTEVRQV